NPNGTWDLFVKPVAGSGNDELLYHSNAVFKHPTSWSFDGRYVVFEALDANSGFDLWTIDMSGDHTPHPYLHGRFNERWGSISPDGRWMLYGSDESGRFEVYVQSFPVPRSKYQVSLGGGAYPTWRRDGR